MSNLFEPFTGIVNRIFKFIHWCQYQISSEGFTFGWEAIKEVYKEDIGIAQDNLAQLVPGLKYAYREGQLDNTKAARNRKLLAWQVRKQNISQST